MKVIIVAEDKTRGCLLGFLWTSSPISSQSQGNPNF